MLRALATAATLLLAACATFPPSDEFTAFYQSLRQDVAAHGEDPTLMDAAFDGLPAPVQAVIPAEKAQPEVMDTFENYTGRFLTEKRIAEGRARLEGNRDALTAVSTRTGIPAEVIVALWGIETNFGKTTGDHPVIPALVTLAWKSPRADFFRTELYAALRIARTQRLNPQNLRGSWAGAMGQCQFMPTNYLKYAQDENGDGTADIWHTPADVFASAATFLKAKGWQPDAPWLLEGAESVNTEGLTLNSRGLSAEHFPLAQWQKRGFSKENSANLAKNTLLRYYKPVETGPAWLVGPNFDTILKWNNSSYFAYTALALADKIAYPEPQTP